MNELDRLLNSAMNLIVALQCSPLHKIPALAQDLAKCIEEVEQIRDQLRLKKREGDKNASTSET